MDNNGFDQLWQTLEELKEKKKVKEKENSVGKESMVVAKERKEEEKAKDMATSFTKEKEEEVSKEEEKEKVEEKEKETSKEDSKEKEKDLEVERQMLVYAIIVTVLVIMRQIADRSKEICKVETLGKHSKKISKVLRLQQCPQQHPQRLLPELPAAHSSCLTSQILPSGKYLCSTLEKSLIVIQSSLS